MQHTRLVRVALLCAFPVAAEGLLVTRSESGIQFIPVFSIAVNGKDKISLLGAKPELTVAVDKLPDAKIGASLLLDANTGVPLQYGRGSTSSYVYPDGIPKKTAPSPAQAWKEAPVSFKKSKQDKVATPLASGQFLAFLANGVAELAEICMDEDALQLMGGKVGAFAARLELTAAAVSAFGTQPEMAQVERKILAFMRERQRRFDDGVESSKSLSEGLRIAELSAKAYPNQADQQQVRKQLATSKAWIDKRSTVLRALAAGSYWDAFLVSYRDFEKHESSYPQLAAKRQDALKASLDKHWQSGKDRIGRNEYRRAYRELRVASQRQPSNEILKRDVSIAWVQHSREVAVDRQNKRKQLSAGEQDVIEQYRVLAQRYKQQNKLDEALAKIGEAEKIDAESLPVVLAKAEILSARNELVSALATLDLYDQLAVDKEREPGNKLRNEVVFQMTDGLDTARKKLSEAWTAGRYHQTLELARQSLLVDDKGPTILYYAGVASMATRHPKEGVAFLTRYLEVSNNLDADVPKRQAVARLLAGGVAAAGLPAEPADGELSWFSGRKNAAGTVYDPLSGMFVPHIDHIAGSNKMTVKFNWEGERLRSIVPAFEKAQQATGEKPFVFTYAEGVPHAAAVDAGDAPRKLPKDPDALLKESNVVLPNNPLVDAPAVQRLSGKAVTVGVAGNRYFHPFVWERPYFFALTHDAQGRLQSARQIADAETRGSGLVEIEFEWNGSRLTSVHGFSLSESGARGTQVYSRTLNYVQDKLMGEEIKAGQKDSKIKYVWNGGSLVSAECDKDETLDNRSRNVVFAVAGGARGRGK